MSSTVSPTYTVTNADSSGIGSLAWAVTQANGHSGPCRIEFEPELAGQVIHLGGSISLTNAEAVIVPLEGLVFSKDKSFTLGGSIVTEGGSFTITSSTKDAKVYVGAAGSGAGITLNQVTIEQGSTGEQVVITAPTLMIGGGIHGADLVAESDFTGKGVAISSPEQDYISAEEGVVLTLEDCDINLYNTTYGRMELKKGGTAHISGGTLCLGYRVNTLRQSVLTIDGTYLTGADGAGFVLISKGLTELSNLETSAGTIISCDEDTVNKSNEGIVRATRVTFGAGSTVKASGDSALVLDGCSFKAGEKRSTLEITLAKPEPGYDSSKTIRNCNLAEVDVEILYGAAGRGPIDLSGNYWGEGYDTLEKIISRIDGYDAGYVIINDWLAEDPVAPQLSLAAPSLSGISAGKGQVVLNWLGGTGASYSLWVDDTLVYSGTESRHALALAGGEHTYTVSATDAFGNKRLASGSLRLDTAAGKLETAGTSPVFTVLNAHASGDGSLAWAIEQANLYRGACRIAFAAELAGQPFTPPQTLAITNGEVTLTAPEGLELTIASELSIHGSMKTEGGTLVLRGSKDYDKVYIGSDIVDTTITLRGVSIEQPYEYEQVIITAPTVMEGGGIQGSDLIVRSTLTARGVAISSPGQDLISVEEGAVLTLEDCEVNMYNTQNGRVELEQGGTAHISGGTLCLGYRVNTLRQSVLTIDGTRLTGVDGAGFKLVSKGLTELSNLETSAGTTISCDEDTVNTADEGMLRATRVTFGAGSTVKASGVSTLLLDSCLFEAGSKKSQLDITLGAPEEGYDSSKTIRNCDLSNVQLKLTIKSGAEPIDLSGNYWGVGMDTLEEITALISGYDARYVTINDWHRVNPLVDFRIASSDARNDSINAGAKSLTLTFTQEIDAASVDQASVRLLDAAGQELAIRRSVTENRLTISWDALPAEGTYSLHISDSVTDIGGNAFVNSSGQEAAYTLRYDVTVPRLLHHEPKDDITGSLTQLTLYFTEAMDEESLMQHLTVRTAAGKTIRPTAVSHQANVCTITLPEQTKLGSYTVSLGEGITDLAGNALVPAEPFTLNLQQISLKVTGAELPDSVACGEKVSITWTGHNEGGSALQGGWTDGAYLSRNALWDIDDIKLGEVKQEGLAAGESYESRLELNWPGLEPGEYYLLVRADIKGDKVAGQDAAAAAQNLVAIPVTVTMPTLSLGGSLSGCLSRSDAVDYVKINRAGSDTASVELSGLATGDSVVVYLAAGRVATRQDYDERYVIGPGSGKVVLPEHSLMQDVYLMLERRQGVGDISYQFTASREALAISSVQATTRDTGKECQLIIDGCNFGTDARVLLIDSRGREYEAAEVLWVNSGQIKASYAAGSLAEGDYGLKVISGSEQVREDGMLTMGGASSSNLRVGITSSSPAIGNHILSTFELSYENTGHEAMEASIITFTISQNGEQKAFLTLDGSLATQGFWTANRPEGFTSSISVLATDGGGLLLPTGRDDSLKANATDDLAHSVTIYYAGWQKPWDYSYPDFELGYSVLDSSNTTPIDWDAIMDGDGIDGKLRQTLTASLQEIVGDTWGDYVAALNRIAMQLDNVGVESGSMGTDELLDVVLRHAMGGYAPAETLAASMDTAVMTGGLALGVSRSYASDLVSRGTKGIFGYGWQSNWDIALVEDEGGDVRITIGGTTLTLQASVKGGYVGAGKDDELYLRKLRDGSFVLKAKKGTTSTFSAEGRLVSQVGTYGDTLEFSYDSAGNMVQASHSSGAWLKFSYNAQGFVSSVSNSYGETTSYRYDAAGNLVGATDYRGQQLQYRYDGEHALTAVVGTDGMVQRIGYDGNALFASTQVDSADGSITGYARNSIEYLAPGVVRVTDAYNASSTYYYDAEGNLLQAVDANGNSIRYSYNAEGQLRSVMYQDGTLTTYGYDEKGNLISTTNAVGATVSMAYDADSQLKTLTDGMGHSQHYTYDSLGQTTSIRYEDGSTETWTYDAQGNMASWTQQDGTQFTYTYDKVGNMLTATSSEGSVWSYSYNAKDMLVSSSVSMASGSSASTTTYTYDANDLLIRMEQEGHSISYTYDDVFRCTSLTDEAGNRTAYRYDSLGRLVSVSNAGGELIRYEYDDKAGRLTKETKANGSSTSYTYTLAGQVESITHHAADGKTVQSFYRYSYDKVGLVVGMQTHEGAWAYEYDAIGQLTHAVFTPLAGSGAQAQDMLYKYDLAGNRTRSVINGVESLYETDAMNRTTQAGGTSYEYDTKGNLVLETAADGTTTTHEYNELNQLVRTTTSKGDVYSYSYDAAGNRITMVKNGVATHYSWDADSKLINEYDAAGNATIHYDYGNNLIGFDEANEYYYTQGDLLGSVTGLTDDSGNLVQVGSWDAFGNRLTDNESTTDASLAGWLGSWGLMTDEDGKTYMRARYYDAELGKFTTSDPIGVNGGLNTYAYCSNNGVSFVDPSGLQQYLFEKVGTYKQMKSYNLITDDQIRDELREQNVPEEQIRQIIDKVNGGGSNSTTSFPSSGTNRQQNSAPNSPSWFAKSKNAIRIFGSSLWEKTKFSCVYWVMVFYSKTPMDVYRKLIWLRNNCKDEYREYYEETLVPMMNEEMRKSAQKGGSTTVDSANSYDPNDLTGTPGYGEQNFIADGTTIDFKLECENDAEATAPARWVRMVTVVDEAYDIDSFQLNSIVFAGNYISVAAGVGSFNKTVELETEGGKVTTGIDISINPETRELTAEFMAIDPVTGFMSQDVMSGILYPEAGYGNGQGYITYSMELKDELATGTKAHSQADIYFDFNDVIPTPELNYTIDSGTPESRLLRADRQADGSLLLTWEAADDAGGSGLAAVHIYVAKDGGALSYWKSFAGDVSSASFTGELGSYGFAILAEDNVGHVEDKTPVPELTASILAPDTTPPAEAEGLLALTLGNAVQLLWNAVDDPGLVSYRVQYVAEGDSWEKAVTIEVGRELSLPIAKLADGLYAWRVQAEDESGNVSGWAVGTAFRIDTSAPELPVPSVRVEGGIAYLGWTSPDATATRYELRYRTEGGTWATLMVEGAGKALDALDDGDYEWAVRAVKDGGLSSDWAAGPLFRIDTTAPELPELTTAPQVQGGSVRLAWAASADASALHYELRYRLAGGAWATRTTTATGLVLDSLADGSYDWSVRAVDAAGNASKWVMGHTFFIDASEPEFREPFAEVQVSGFAATFSWAAASDASALHYELRYRVEGGAWVTRRVAGTSIRLDLSERGAYEWGVRAVDALGNASQWLPGKAFEVAQMIPPVSMDAPAMSKSGNGKMKVTLSWVGEAGVRYTLVVDGKTVLRNKTTTLWKGSLKDGTHSYRLSATDAAGNSSALEGEFSYDATAPKLKLKAPTLRKAGEGLVEATFAWDGHEEGLTYTITLDKDKKPCHSSGDPNPVFTLADGKHSYVVLATDATGNSCTVKGSFTFDATAPRLTLNPYKAKQGKDGKVNATLSWKGEGGCRYTLVLDGQEIELKGKTSYKLTLDAGETADYYVVATDKAGNTVSSEQRVVRYDTAAPVISKLAHGMQLGAGGDAETVFSWNCRDAGGVTYVIKVDGKVVKDALVRETRLADGSVACSYTHSATLKGGKHRYEITATDWAGNKLTVKGDGFATPKFSVSKPRFVKVDSGKVDATLAWKGDEDARYTLELDGQVVGTGVTPGAKGAYSYTGRMNDGLHHYRLTAVNAAGHYTVTEGAFDYDATAPGLILGDVTGKLSGKVISKMKVKVTFGWIGEEGVSYTIKSGGKRIASGKKTSCSYSFKLGTYELDITAKDKAGNAYSFTARLSVGERDGQADVCWAEHCYELPAAAQQLAWFGADTEGIRPGAEGAEGAEGGYSFTLTEARQLRLALGGLEADATLRLNRVGGFGDIELAANAFTGLDRELSLSAGTYHLQVLPAGGAALGDYVLDIELGQNGKKAAFAQAVLAPAL